MFNSEILQNYEPSEAIKFAIENDKGMQLNEFSCKFQHFMFTGLHTEMLRLWEETLPYYKTNHYKDRIDDDIEIEVCNIHLAYRTE